MSSRSESSRKSLSRLRLPLGPNGLGPDHHRGAHVPAVKNPKRSSRRQPKPAALPRALDDGRESLDLYLDEISRIPLLTVDEEKALARKAFRGDVLAQDRLARATTYLAERLGRAPTTEELVEATGLTPESVRSLGALHIEALRLDQPMRADDDRSRMERVALASDEGTDAATLAKSRTSDLETALASLPPRDAKVIRLYFGLDDGRARTLEEIGRMMGVTRERIRQLRDRALKQLKEQ